MLRALGTLTGDGGAVARLVGHDELVLEAAAPDALRPDEHQRFPAERRHSRDLLVDEQLMTVELWGGTGLSPTGDSGAPQPMGATTRHRGGSPAFLVVRYIILFFLFPLRLPHRDPAEGKRG